MIRVITNANASYSDNDYNNINDSTDNNKKNNERSNDNNDEVTAIIEKSDTRYI